MFCSTGVDACAGITHTHTRAHTHTHIHTGVYHLQTSEGTAKQCAHLYALVSCGKRESLESPVVDLAFPRYSCRSLKDLSFSAYIQSRGPEHSVSFPCEHHLCGLYLLPLQYLVMHHCITCAISTRTTRCTAWQAHGCASLKALCNQHMEARL